MVRKLALVTASVFALGFAGSGLAAAANSSTNMPAQSNLQSQTPTASKMQNQAESTPMTQGAQNAPVKLSQGRIKQLQQQLKTAGLYKGAVDGNIGPETKRAVSQFQHQNGLTQTGTVDEETMAALNNNQNNPGNQSNFGSSGGTQPSSSAGGLDQPSTQNSTTR